MFSRFRRTSLVRRVFAASLLAAPLYPSTAVASVDTFDVGDGHDGPLAVAAGASVVVNTYSQLSAGANAGSSSITVVAIGANQTAFQAGDLVLIWEDTGETPAPTPGSQTPVDLSASALGQWELARVATVTNNGTQLGFTGPLVNTYSANTQVVRVPEYTTVTIGAGGSIVATPWAQVTGAMGQVIASGGVVAFLATGAIANAGTITASGAGFRGGQPANDSPLDLLCSALSSISPAGGQDGEGIGGPTLYTTSAGDGNLADGAGGGVCQQSGGGGGGNGGTGGLGGFSSASDGSRNVGGLGGAPVTYSMRDHVIFGGGGGAGHELNAGSLAAGNGGGVVFIRAGSLTGTGLVASRGGDVGTGGDDGQGGGGAGGAVYLRLIGTADCQMVDVSGGQGGSSSASEVGPGGGGAGGQVFLQAAPGGTCPVNIGCGLAGTQSNPNPMVDGGSDPQYGATPISASSVFCQGVDQPAPPTGYCGSNADCPPPATCNQNTGVCELPDGGTGDAGTGDGGASDGGDGGTSDGAVSDGAGNDGAGNDGAAGDGSAQDAAGGDAAADSGSGGTDSGGDAMQGNDAMASNDATTDAGTGDGSGGGDATTEGGAPDGSYLEGGGCACSQVGGSSGAAGATLALLALAGFAARRRRSR